MKTKQKQDTNHLNSNINKKQNLQKDIINIETRPQIKNLNKITKHTQNSNLNSTCLNSNSNTKTNLLLRILTDQSQQSKNNDNNQNLVVKDDRLDQFSNYSTCKNTENSSENSTTAKNLKNFSLLHGVTDQNLKIINLVGSENSINNLQILRETKTKTEKTRRNSSENYGISKISTCKTSPVKNKEENRSYSYLKTQVETETKSIHHPTSELITQQNLKKLKNHQKTTNLKNLVDKKQITWVKNQDLAFSQKSKSYDLSFGRKSQLSRASKRIRI